MYDASIGRFLSEDPIGFAGGDANLSRYVGNAATSLVDPDGLLPRAGHWSGAPGDSFFVFDDSSLPIIRYVNGHPDFTNHVFKHDSGVLAEALIQGDCDLSKTDNARLKSDMRAADVEMARKVKGWERPAGFTWHHQWVDGTGKMQMVLIKSNLHAAATHKGAFAAYTAILRARQTGDRASLLAAHQFRRTLGFIGNIAKRGMPALAAYCTFSTARQGWAADGASGAFHALMKDAMFDAEVRQFSVAGVDFVGGILGVDNGDVTTRKRVRSVGGIVDPLGNMQP